jgi:hypothetical protein
VICLGITSVLRPVSWPWRSQHRRARTNNNRTQLHALCRCTSPQGSTRAWRQGSHTHKSTRGRALELESGPSRGGDQLPRMARSYGSGWRRRWWWRCDQEGVFEGRKIQPVGVEQRNLLRRLLESDLGYASRSPSLSEMQNKLQAMPRKSGTLLKRRLKLDCVIVFSKNSAKLDQQSGNELD